jgi:hypothetical protein
MQLKLLFALALLSPSPALACSVAVSTPGVLGLSGDGTQLGSDSGVGVAAVLSISDLGALFGTDITISPPTLQTSPAGFATGGLIYESRFTATWLVVNTLTRPYSTSAQTFHVPSLGALALAVTLHNRVTASGGFKAGSYGTRTVITCS